MSEREPPPPGYLLSELGYVDEIEAAAAIDVTPKKRWLIIASTALAPIIPRWPCRIIYSKDALAEWLKAGGTRERA
jgi:hypothetical protein